VGKGGNAMVANVALTAMYLPFRGNGDGGAE
jgi:hypothetical protein